MLAHFLLWQQTYILLKRIDAKLGWPRIKPQLLSGWVSKGSLQYTILHVWGMNHHRLIFLVKIYSIFYFCLCQRNTIPFFQQFFSQNWLGVKCSQFHISGKKQPDISPVSRGVKKRVYSYFCLESRWLLTEHRGACYLSTPSSFTTTWEPGKKIFRISRSWVWFVVCGLYFMLLRRCNKLPFVLPQ